VVSFIAQRGASDAGKNPVAGDSQAAQAGRQAFTGSCAQCHGAAGDGRGVFGQGTFPQASDLTSQSTRALTDEQMFYVIKNGLGYSGMPGFASQYADRDIWSFVTFIRELQRGQSKAFEPVAPTGEQLTFANFQSAEGPQRGAAVYFAQGCAVCHGPTGEGPEQITVDVKSPKTTQAVREGTKGMPRYSSALISDAQLRDLLEYLATWPNREEE
jgi:mono/diheme cytochrome c family protein